MAPPVSKISPSSALPPFEIPRTLLACGFICFMAGGFLDYQLGAIPWRVFSIPYWQSVIGTGLLVLLLAGDRREAWRPRLKWFSISLLVCLALFYLLHDLAGVVKRREVIRLMAVSPGFYAWIATLWLGLPLARARTPGGRSRSWVLRWGAGLLLAFLTWQLASCVTSCQPETSLYFLVRERALLFALLMGWLRACESDEQLFRITTRGGVIISGLLIVAAALMIALDIYGSPAIHAKLVDWRLVYERGLDAGREMPNRRILFPMLHFNRTGWFAMLAIFTQAAAFCARKDERKPWRWLALGAFFLGLYVLYYSFTRGAIIGAGAGLLLAAVFYSRRFAIVALVAVLFVPFLVPKNHRYFLRTVIKSQTYQVDREGPLTSMQARLIAWRWGQTQIASKPLTGMGYGASLVADAYERYVMTEGDLRVRESIQAGYEMIHLHNMWLETAVESGVPAGALLLLFLSIRWFVLLQHLRGTKAGWPKRRIVLLLGMEAAIMVAGCIFYMLKKNSGYYTWYAWVWVLMWIEMERAKKTAVPDEETAAA